MNLPYRLKCFSFCLYTDTGGNTYFEPGGSGGISEEHGITSPWRAFNGFKASSGQP